jgi:hypothetical protein
MATKLPGLLYTEFPVTWCRAQLRADQGATYSHLNGMSRDDFGYFLGQFSILIRRGAVANGEDRTALLYLEAYDEFGWVRVATACAESSASTNPGKGGNVPFEMPWAKRKRMQVESHEGCAGAVEYARKVKLILDEFLRITGDVTKRGMFRQRDYSYVLGLLQEQEKLTPPPAAVDLHAAMLELLRATRSGIRNLDPAGDQDIDDINRVFDEAERIFLQTVAAPMDRFNAACFPDQANRQENQAEVQQTLATALYPKESVSPASRGISANDPAAVDRARLARFLRHQSQGVVPSELQDLQPVAVQLDALAKSPDRFDDLDQEWLSLLTFHQMLTYAYASTEERGRLGILRTLYLLVTSTLGTRSRLALEDDVAKQLDSHVRVVEVLKPFMWADPHSAVVSTAALDIATLMPLQNGDELTGPATVARQAMQWIDDDEMRAAAMIAGLLMLGDARILPRVGFCWRRLGQAGKNILMEQQSGAVFASTVEFFLQWIETVDEDDFGHPAGALGRLAEGMVRHPGVRDVQRKFPAPFNLSDEEFRADPPFRVLQEWTREDFARTIEPRLRMAYIRETYDKVMPRVLQAWGLEVGEDDPGDQIHRMVEAWNWAKSQLAQIDDVTNTAAEPPWEARARSTVASIFRNLPVETALPQTFEEINRLKQEAEDRRSRAGEHTGSSMYGRLMQAGQHFDLEAEAIMRHLQYRFGLDPRSTLTIMAAMRAAANPDQPESDGERHVTREAVKQFSPQDYGRALSTALETLGAAVDERDQAIDDMTHPANVRAALSAARIAAAAPTRVDETLGNFITTMPPDEFVSLHKNFMFAINELLRQWRAELAAFGANLAQNERDAAAQASEAQRAKSAFSKWWTQFQRGFRAIEQDSPDQARSLDLTAAARNVIEKTNWDSPSQS